MAFLKFILNSVYFLISLCITIILVCFLFLKLISPPLILQPRAETLAYDLVDYATTNDRMLTEKYIWNYLRKELRGKEFASFTYRQQAGDRRFFIDFTLSGTTFTMGQSKVTYKGLLYESIPRQSLYFTVDSYDDLDELTDSVNDLIEEGETTTSPNHKNTTKVDEERSQSLNGARIYKQSCASCHGQYLEGAAGPSLINIDQKYTDNELSKIIEEGIEPGMPANVVQASEKDILVEWLITLQ